MPPPNLAPGDYVKVTHRMGMNGQVGMITCWYGVVTISGTSQPISAAAVAFGIAANASLPGVLTGAATTLQTLAELYITLTRRVLVSAYSGTGHVAGTAGVQAVPSQACPVLQKQTGFAGRSQRGRVYLPFSDVAATDASGEILPATNAAYLAAINGAFPLSMTVVPGANQVVMAAVLVHKGAPITSTPVSAWAITDKMGTQKRRGDYGRLNSQIP